jgi:hypothetical protein
MVFMISKAMWPDMTNDQKAWELAKGQAEPNESLSVTVQRAEQFKQALNAAKEKE